MNSIAFGMKRRTLVLRIGDHWFLRHVRDLYEALTTRYTTSDQPRGIMSVFPSHLSSPFWFREQIVEKDLAYYLKDNESNIAFNQQLDNDAELKIYIAGHCRAGSSTLHSLETNEALHFELGVEALAAKLHSIFTKMGAKPTITSPIKISLICCEAASGSYFLTKKDAFATQLLEQLHALGHQHILVKARELSVSAPLWGHKHTAGKKEHFYLDENHTIYHVQKENDLRFIALKVLKQCHARTKVAKKQDYLEQCIQRIQSIGYTTNTSQLDALKTIIQEASQTEEIKQYQYGTAWFMKLFGLKSNTENALEQLHQVLEARTDTYNTLVERLPHDDMTTSQLRPV